MRRDPLYDATRDEVESARPWARWSAWWERRAKELTTAAKVAAAATAILGSIKAALLMRARDVGRADAPNNGGDRMFVDRVDKPKAP